MSPEEKALIDARREGFVEAMTNHFSALDLPRIYDDAARAFPYPPEPQYFVSVGERWRLVDDHFEVSDLNDVDWRPVRMAFLSPALVRGLARLLPPEETP